MKKKVLLLISTASFVLFNVGVSGKGNKIHTQDPSFYWFSPGFGQPDTYHDFNTINGEIATTGCSGNILPCESGYTMNQVNFSTVPWQLKSSAISSATIRFIF